VGVKTFALATLAASLASAAGPQSLADLPDPLVGTDSRYELSHGNTYPAVFVPFGMIGWTAQTGEGGWPYQYSKDTIQGFLATHRPSAWMSDYGPFSFMPVTGELKVLPRERAARFRHQDEDARAYRYSVVLQASGIRAEMAPARRGGALRFRPFASTSSRPEAAAAWSSAYFGHGLNQFRPPARLQRGRFGIIVGLSWNNRTMADMKSFARALADEAKRELSALAEADKMQLHGARVLDAESRPFWISVKTALSTGIAEYDSCLTGTAVEQNRFIADDDDSVIIKWRYPRPQELVVLFEFERRLICLAKRNLNDPAEALRDFRLSVDRDDRVLASDDLDTPIGGATELAQAILRFMLAGSMA
jgi:hypothetical protein